MKGLWRNPLLFVSAMFVLLIAVPASAHNVIVFGWAEGNTVFTESKFSSGRMAKNALIEVFDPKGTKLLKGKTDDKGEFSFKIPQRSALEIVLTAGTGHKNKWSIPKEEIEAALASVSDSKPAANKRPEPPSNSGSMTDPGSAVTSQTRTTPSNSVDIARIEALVSRLLDRKLGPISHKLNRLAAQENGVDYRDVIGGIGYIVGIIGIVAYFRASKRKDGDRTS